MLKWLFGTRKSSRRVSEEETLIEMIELRRKKDRVLRKQPHPSNVPVFQLWRTPEYVIYSLMGKHSILREDGLPESAATRKIDNALRLNCVTRRDELLTLSEYLKRVLKVYSPNYLLLGDNLLGDAVALAQARVHHLAAEGARGYPPEEWLGSEILLGEFESEFSKQLNSQSLLIPTSRFDSDFSDFILRLQDGDKLVRFSSPDETWQMMMGRAGVALVRNGSSIGCIETMMN
jgi:hypothetical protein